jgi:AhpD family alkylhydroperoxidase
MTTSFTFSLPPIADAAGAGAAGAVFTGAQQRMGMVPNMYRRMAHAPALLTTYAAGYDGFRAEAGFTAAEQELVFLTISMANGCDYCTAAHTFLASRVPELGGHVRDALRDGSAIADVRLATLRDFTQHLLESKGRPSADAAARFLAAGYTEPQVLYLVLAIAVKILSNYANHMFDTPIDPVFGGAQGATVSA